ncbi:MAG: EMC3/TMCO1 family protein, partial [Nanoarchaeota archaeon]
DLVSIIILYPQASILLISFLVTLFITIISHYFTDKKLMREIKDKQKRLREEMKQHKDNPQKMMEINKQMMEDFPTQMKQSMKVSLITIIPLLFLFNWLKVAFGQTAIATNWIGWYILASLIFSLILRKVFKLD